MSLRERTHPGLGIIEPYDGFRIMARRDGAGVRLITREAEEDWGR
jgi:ATP-dependent DNA ligase